MTQAEENDHFRAICRKNGWRCTPQRLAVFRYMEHNFNHPSVDQVWNGVRAELPAITRESVFRILNELVQADVVVRLDRIECAHYDGRITPHGHLVCEKCGGVTDFSLPELPVLPREIDLKMIRHMELRVSWLCPDCRKP